MNRIQYLIPVCLFIALFPFCNKRASESASARLDLIHQANAFVDSISLLGYPSNVRAAQPKTIRWEFARIVQTGQSKKLIAPIVFDNAIMMKANFTGDQLFHLSYLTQLVFTVDSVGSRKAFVVTEFPDSNFFKNPAGSFTGLKFIEDWLGHPIEKLLFTSDGKIKRFSPNKTQPALAEVVQTCYSVVGYNYSPELDEVYSWSEEAGCSVNFLDDGEYNDIGGGTGSGGATGPGGGAGSPPITVLPGNSIIKSIKTYFQCFTNVGGSDHTYSVTVCVDQPDPGTRTAWTTSQNGSSGSSSGNNPIDAGHTFLILTETYDGTTISRNIGFYPAGDVSPLRVTSQGSLNDDETHIYNISGSFTVNDAQFFNILNFVSQGNSPGYLYNLNTNNCTTFAINALAQAGIDLPRTIGTWFDGTGEDPGDLGEDLRKNNITGMTLNLNGGSANSHFNDGQCN